jgi:hypothetical protein
MSNQMTLLEIYKSHLSDIREEKSNQMQITNYILIIYTIIYLVTSSKFVQYKIPTNIACILVGLIALFGIFYVTKTQIQIFKIRKLIDNLKKERWEFTKFLDNEDIKISKGNIKLGFMIFLNTTGAVILFKIILDFDKVIFSYTAVLLLFMSCIILTAILVSFVKLIIKINTK